MYIGTINLFKQKYGNKVDQLCEYLKQMTSTQTKHVVVLTGASRGLRNTRFTKFLEVSETQQHFN
jgi:hypothetical protein